MSEENNKFTLDGKEYLLENESDQAKYIVFSLNELNKKRQETQAELALLNAAEIGFVEQLRETIKEEQPEEVKEGEVV